MTTPPTPQATSLADALKASLAAARQRPIACPNCSATLYTHHHTECPRYGTEPPWEPIGSDWQFGRDDSVSLALSAPPSASGEAVPPENKER